jgi:hypothetical protein
MFWKYGRGENDFLSCSGQPMSFISGKILLLEIFQASICYDILLRGFDLRKMKPAVMDRRRSPI